MSCSHCPHCRALANPAALTLTRPPASSPQTGSDLDFYREFGLAYDRARTQRLRPRQAIMAANPWLTDSQCTAYLKRARAYGFVQTPPRKDFGKTPVAPPVVPASPPAAAARRQAGGRLQTLTGEQCSAVLFSGEEGMELLTANCDRGVPITGEKLRRTHSRKLSEREASDVLQWAVNSGMYQWAAPGESILPADG